MVVKRFMSYLRRLMGEEYNDFYIQVVYNGYYKFVNIPVGEIESYDIKDIKTTKYDKPINTFVCWGLTSKNIDRRLRDSDIEVIPFFVVDIDHIEDEHRERILSFFDRESNLKPAYISSTGRGMHLYFKYNDTKENFRGIHSIVRSYIKENIPEIASNVDDKVSNPARIIRLVYTYKFKSVRNCGAVKMLRSYESFTHINMDTLIDLGLYEKYESDFLNHKKIKHSDVAKIDEIIKESNSLNDNNFKYKSTRGNIVVNMDLVQDPNLRRLFFMVKTNKARVKYDHYLESIKKIESIVGKKVFVKSRRGFLEVSKNKTFIFPTRDMVIKHIYNTLGYESNKTFEYGRNLRCLKHIDKTPSLKFNSDSGTFYCFSSKCGQSKPISAPKYFYGLKRENIKQEHLNKLIRPLYEEGWYLKKDEYIIEVYGKLRKVKKSTFDKCQRFFKWARRLKVSYKNGILYIKGNHHIVKEQNVFRFLKRKYNLKINIRGVKSYFFISFIKKEVDYNEIVVNLKHHRRPKQRNRKKIFVRKMTKERRWKLNVGHVKTWKNPKTVYVDFKHGMHALGVDNYLKPKTLKNNFVQMLL